jgi:hypothetical protein
MAVESARIPHQAFPAGDIESSVRRLSAIVRYHSSGAGIQEHEHLLGVATLEARNLLNHLTQTEKEWDGRRSRGNEGLVVYRAGPPVEARADQLAASLASGGLLSDE